MKATVRERTFTWEDPRTLARTIFERGDHLAWLNEIRERVLQPPPIAMALGYDIEEIEPGRIVFSMNASEWMTNPAGIIHGGMAATLLDTVLTLAVTTQLPPDKMCTTLDLNVHFVRPLFPTEEKVCAEGKALHIGTTIGTAEGRLHDARGRLIAHGTASLAIVDMASLARSVTG